MIFKDDFKVLYENDSTSNYLVLRTSAEKNLLNYQSQMLLHNKLTGLLDFNINRIGDELNCFYDITSKCTLTAFLERKVFNRDEFLKTILNIVNNIYQLKNFLLYDNNILLDENFIYVAPDSIDIYFVYLPFQDCTNDTKAFFTKLIFQLVKFNDEYSDNYIQKILQTIKSDQFNLSNLKSLIENLLYEDVKQINSKEEYEDVKIENNKQINDNPIVKKFKQGKILFNRNDQDKLQNDKCKIFKEEAKTNNEIKIDNLENEILKAEDAYNGAEIKKGNFRIPSNKKIEKQHNTESWVSIPFNVDQNTSEKDRKKDENQNNKTINLFLFASILFQPLMIVGIYLILKSDFVRLSENPKTTVIILILIFLAIDVLIIRITNNKLKQHKNSSSQENITAKESDKTLQIISSKMKEKNVKANEGFFENKAIELPNLVNENYNGETVIIKRPKALINPYLKAKESEEVIQINKSSILIGRMESFVDYVINSSAIGKIHAEIIQEGEEVFIMDCNSKNGTFINDKRILPNTKNGLKNDDILRFANKEYVFFNCVRAINDIN